MPWCDAGAALQRCLFSCEKTKEPEYFQWNVHIHLIFLFSTWKKQAFPWQWWPENKRPTKEGAMNTLKTSGGVITVTAPKETSGSDVEIWHFFSVQMLKKKRIKLKLGKLFKAQLLFKAKLLKLTQKQNDFLKFCCLNMHICRTVWTNIWKNNWTSMTDSWLPYILHLGVLQIKWGKDENYRKNSQRTQMQIHPQITQFY